MSRAIPSQVTEIRELNQSRCLQSCRCEIFTLLEYFVFHRGVASHALLRAMIGSRGEILLILGYELVRMR